MDARHRVALPREVMEELGVDAGGYVAFLRDDGEVRVVGVRFVPSR